MWKRSTTLLADMTYIRLCESFMNILKSEEINCRSYSTMEELKQNIEEFIERIYNCERLHSALAYRPPEEFELAAATEPPQSGFPVTLSFPRHRKSILMPVKLNCIGERHAALRATHQDEFPTVYSLAGCSPAEPASASRALCRRGQSCLIPQAASRICTDSALPTAWNAASN